MSSQEERRRVAPLMGLGFPVLGNPLGSSCWDPGGAWVRHQQE